MLPGCTVDVFLVSSVGEVVRLVVVVDVVAKCITNAMQCSERKEYAKYEVQSDITTT